jgi:glycine oxidase
VDVGIVGGGLIGVALAAALRELGAGVTLFERGQLGGEASTAAGGILGAQTESEEISEGPSLLDLVRARDASIDWAERLEHEGHGATGLSKHGVLKLAFDDDELAAFDRLGAWQRSAGLVADILTSLPITSPSACGGLFFPRDAHVEPPLYFAAAVRSARALGAMLLEGQNVTDVGETGAGAFVALGAERRTFDRVVLTAGSWTSQLLDSLQVKPIRGQMLELRAKERAFGPVVFAGGVYSIPRSDGRVTVGSTMEDVGHLRGIDAAGVHHLLAGALRAVPALAQAELVRAWSAFRPYSPHGVLAGPTQTPGVFVLTGHHRNGILLARSSALSMAQRLLNPS